MLKLANSQEITFLRLNPKNQTLINCAESKHNQPTALKEHLVGLPIGAAAILGLFCSTPLL